MYKVSIPRLCNHSSKSSYYCYVKKFNFFSAECGTRMGWHSWNLERWVDSSLMGDERRKISICEKEQCLQVQMKKDMTKDEIAIFEDLELNLYDGFWRQSHFAIVKYSEG